MEKHIDKNKQIFYNNKNITKDVDLMEQKLPKIDNNDIIEYANNNTDIKDLIYTIRGKQVMLDSDVARLYHYKTKALNLAVKRNIERFPKEFRFQLTEEEVSFLRFQNETSKMKQNIIQDNRGGRRYLPYVFTEHGITMLAGILKSEIAVEISIKIINSFVEMRRFLNNYGQVFQEISNIKGKLVEHDKKFKKYEYA